jgi:hypothetical protein
MAMGPGAGEAGGREGHLLEIFNDSGVKWSKAALSTVAVKETTMTTPGRLPINFA